MFHKLMQSWIAIAAWVMMEVNGESDFYQFISDA